MTKNHNLLNERYRNTAVTGAVDTAQDKSDEKQVCIWTRQVPSLAKPGSLPTMGFQPSRQPSIRMAGMEKPQEPSCTQLLVGSSRALMYPQCQIPLVYTNVKNNFLSGNWQLQCVLLPPSDSELITLQNSFFARCALFCISCIFILSFTSPSSSISFSTSVLPPSFSYLINLPLWPAFEKVGEEIK